MARFTLTIPNKALEEFDKAIDGYYVTRNAAILEAMKQLQQKLKEKQK